MIDDDGWGCGSGGVDSKSRQAHGQRNLDVTRRNNLYYYSKYIGRYKQCPVRIFIYSCEHISCIEYSLLCTCSKAHICALTANYSR